MSRQQRLQNGPTMTLYHQTDVKAARSIVTSGKFRCGSTGLAGAGIYFATSSNHTNHKAHKKGVIITCSVTLGNMKTIGKNGDSSLTGSKVKA
mmetsp:Transcript_65961/g.59239  ORF Transcript_65961/g.59239 Transcript_65961/m.59239 type:complete len:93 (-) Transcript_65961:319-597(-)